MRKGFLEYCILQILRKKAAYASDIISELKDAKLIVVEGTMYPLLTRLKKDEYISMESIEKICVALDCGVDDILEFIGHEATEEKERDNG